MFLAPLAAAACLVLAPGADRITAADLAPAFPGLQSVPAGTTLSLAPAPGVDRIFQIPELQRIAAQYRLETPASEICVARAVAPLDPAALLAAMQKEMPDARIAILEVTKAAAPQGEIVFHRSGLRANSVSGAFWYGAVRYAPNREFSIWAKVTVTAQVSRVFAKRDIAPGKIIEADDIEIQTRDEFPTAGGAAMTFADVAGKTSRIGVHAGSPIRAELLDKARDVHQGDVVEVEVQEGGAHLKFEARAEASGATGDVIPMRNPQSNKRFMAKVEGKGRVFVEVSIAKVNP